MLIDQYLFIDVVSITQVDLIFMYNLAFLAITYNYQPKSS